MKRDNIIVNDRQLACAKINSQEGQDYLKGMAGAANYAWVNRSSMTFLCRQVRLPLTLPKDFHKPSKPCHVGTHWMALAEYFQMSTHMLGFQ